MRKKNIIIPLLLIFIPFYGYQNSVKINEIMVNPQYDTSNGENYSSNEYIELYNSSPYSVSLAQWFIAIDDKVEPINLFNSPFCPLSTNLTLQPFSYAIIFPGGYKGYWQQNISQNRWGTIPLYLTTHNNRLGKYGLNNNQGLIKLINPEQQTVSTIEWNRLMPQSQSWEKINCAGGDELYNWRLAPINSPGFANSCNQPLNQPIDSIFSLNKPLCITQNGSYNDWFVTIKLQENQIANLELFNLQGYKVQSMLHNFQQSGTTTISWIKDNNQIGSGMHLLKLTIRSTQNKKLIYQKIKKVIIVTLK